MPAKRPHTKSRTGCRVCRTRRVKVSITLQKRSGTFNQPFPWSFIVCHLSHRFRITDSLTTWLLQCDEVRPACGQCRKRSVECYYDRIVFISQNGPNRGQTHRSSSTQSKDDQTALVVATDSPRKSPPFFGQPSTRMIELRLMNHYTVMLLVHPKFCNPNLQLMWTYSIPQQAAGRDYLMDAILSLAALHLHVHRPHDVQMERVSHHSIATTFHNMQHQLENLDPTNASTAFAACLLIQFQSFASWKDPCTSSGTYQLPIQWFNMAQKARSMLYAASSQVTQSERDQFNECSTLTAEQRRRRGCPDDPFQIAFELLEGQDLSEDNRLTLCASLDLIYSIYISILHGESMSIIRRLIHSFPVHIDMRFVELLKQQDPRAMIVLGYYFAVLRRVDDVWWLRGRSEWEIKGITNYLPACWKPFMAWPLKVINAEPSEPLFGTETEATPEMHLNFECDEVIDDSL